MGCWFLPTACMHMTELCGKGMGKKVSSCKNYAILSEVQEFWALGSEWALIAQVYVDSKGTVFKSDPSPELSV